MQITVKKIFKNDTDKEGNKLMSKKYNKPYFKVDVYYEGSEEKISAFANSTTDPVYNMVEGGTYSVAIEEKTVGDRVFKNFKMLTPEEKELEELRAFKASQSSTAPTFEPTNDVDAETSDLDTF